MLPHVISKVMMVMTVINNKSWTALKTVSTVWKSATLESVGSLKRFDACVGERIYVYVW